MHAGGGVGVLLLSLGSLLEGVVFGGARALGLLAMATTTSIINLPFVLQENSIGRLRTPICLILRRHILFAVKDA